MCPGALDRVIRHDCDRRRQQCIHGARRHSGVRRPALHRPSTLRFHRSTIENGWQAHVRRSRSGGDHATDATNWMEVNDAARYRIYGSYRGFSPFNVSGVAIHVGGWVCLLLLALHWRYLGRGRYLMGAKRLGTGGLTPAASPCLRRANPVTQPHPNVNIDSQHCPQWWNTYRGNKLREKKEMGKETEIEIEIE